MRALAWQHMRFLRHRVAQYPEAVALVSFLLLLTFFALSTEGFLTPLSLSNILTFGSITGIVVVGVALLMIAGEFDLSVGSNFAVASYVFALGLNGQMPPLLALALAVGTSTLLGLLNGLVVVFGRIPSFIVTLGTLLAYRGLARALGGGKFATYKGEPPALFTWLNGPLEGLNQLFAPPANFRVSILWFLLIVAAASYLLLRTRLGNWIYATGGNPQAARAQGVPVHRVKLFCFSLAGALAGWAGVLQFAHRTSVDPLRGAGMELIAVAASVIGGVRLSGGYGTVLGAALGLLTIQMLDQGLVLMQVPIQVFQAFVGLLILLAVISNTYLARGD